MSKNTNLSFLTDFLTADIVNSRVGINNASPQTTFDVTGTGKFSGVLTLGSTVSNGTYAYTLPSATGTLALISDIPSVSGYVPYTGATLDVNLGVNTLTSKGLNVDVIAGQGGALNLRQATNFSLWTGAAYTSIYAISGNRLIIMFSNDNRQVTLDGSIVSAASPRTFTFPDATGTFALTSQIPTNAVGGTGTLNTIPKFTAASTIGNSNIFDSGSIIYNTNPVAGQFAWQFGGSTVAGQSYGAQVIAGTNASDIGFKVMNAAATINYLVVRGDGLVTLTGALNGTSASFTGAVTSDDLILTAGALFGAGNTGLSNRLSDTTLYLQMPATGFNITDNALNTRFILASTGAATFTESLAITKASSIFQLGNSTNNSYGAVQFLGNATGNGNTLGELDFFNKITGTNTLSAQIEIIHEDSSADNKSKMFFKVHNGTSLITPLTLASTGAATFSSSVTATNIGINTTSDLSQKLVINQGVTAINQGIPATSGTTQNGILRLRPAVGVFGETLDFGMNVGPTYGWIQATNASGLNTNYNLILNPNGGNVGIGTDSPGAVLDVRATIAGDLLRLGMAPPSGNYFGFSRSGSTGALHIQGTQVGNNNIVLAPTSGNVLIGTTTDNGAKLQVAGTGRFSSSVTAEAVGGGGHVITYGSAAPALNATGTLATGVSYAIIAIYETTNTGKGCILLMAAGALTIVSNPSGDYTTTVDTANKWNVTVSSGVISIQNKRASGDSFQATINRLV